MLPQNAVSRGQMPPAAAVLRNSVCTRLNHRYFNCCPQVLRPFMLRRLKETVASELPQKREHVLRGGCGADGRRETSRPA